MRTSFDLFTRCGQEPHTTNSACISKLRVRQLYLNSVNMSEYIKIWLFYERNFVHAAVMKLWRVVTMAALTAE